MVLDFFIEKRLSEGWLVLLVVPIPSKPNYIDEDIFVELLPVSHCDLHAFVKDIGNIAVYMNHRSIDSLGNFGAVIRGASLLGMSGKPDLIVEDNMDDASWTVVDQILES